MKKEILIILHHSSGTGGRIQSKLIELGYELDIRCIIEGDTLPNASNYAGVVVFGGIMSANDCQTIKGIHKEINWIPSIIEADIPYLGICLGAQLLSRALGGTVCKKSCFCQKCPTVEIGFHPVKPKGKEGNKFLPKGDSVFYHWHFEGFSIPKGCECIAENNCFQNQAFKLNDKVIGLQFHPEATKEMIEQWVQREPNNLKLNGAQDYKTQMKLYDKYDKEINVWLDEFLDNWLNSN